MGSAGDGSTWFRELFRTKSLEQLRRAAEKPEHTLRKNLGTFDLTMFGLGAIIGAGIFSAIGTAAAGNLVDGRAPAGPSLVISILIVAAACGFTALAYAEMASMIPISGSAYTYVYATMGELAAWIIGWDLLLEYAVSNVAVAISWGDYTRSFLWNVLGVHFPRWLCIDPGSVLKLKQGVAIPAGGKMQLLEMARSGQVDGAGTFLNWETLRDAPTLFGYPVTVNLLAVAITIAVTWLVYIGIRESARANSAMVAVKIVILMTVVGIGLFFITPSNYSPFFPAGWQGVQCGAAIIFFAFIGFDAVSTTAEECREPEKNLPRGILLSLAICTVIYALVALVVTGIMRYTDLHGQADPLAYIFSQNGMNGLAGVISFGAVIATTAALLVYQIGQPRIFMAMSRDGLLGPWFGKISPRHKTPANATWLTGALVMLPAAVLNIDEVVELTNIGTLFAFSLVCVGVMILRVRRPDTPRKFRMPWVWFCAPAGILFCTWLALGLPLLTWLRFFFWLTAGLVIYFAYGRRRSRLSSAVEKTAPDGDVADA